VDRFTVPLKGWLSRWITAGVLIAIATAVNLSIQPLTGGRAPFQPFYPAIMAVGFLSGLVPGTAALAVSALIIDFFWLQPTGSLTITSAQDLAALAEFLVGGGIALTVSVAARHVITELRRTRVSLDAALETARCTEKELRTISDAMPVAISFVTGAECRYVFTNAGWVRWFAADRQQHADIQLREGIGADAYELIRPLLEGAQHGRAMQLESRLAGPGAQLRDVSIRCIPEQTQGSVAGVVVLIEDITARKQAEAALREADQRKDEFLATLAHELRNPMAPIRYAAASLRQGTAEGAMRHAGEVIERQAGRMARLLDDLLDISRVTRNVIHLEPTRVDLRELVQEATEMAKPQLTDLQHRLIVSIPPNPLWVHVDTTRLLQVMGNLLDNAAKYTHAGGSIEIRLQGEDDHAVVQVTDNGIGLTPEMIPKIFELFAQPHKTMGVERGGLGVGLTVAKRLVELHGGAMEARSEGLDRGSQFVVRLPLVMDPQETRRETAHANVVPLFGSRPHVLIVDDNRDGAETLAEVLRGEGFAVSVAFDAAEALRAFDAVSPGVVLLDMGLPDISGMNVAQEMRARPAGSSVRIIAITGWGQESDRERTRRAGVDLHLVKPVDPELLLATLGESVNELRPDSPASAS
jgi:signal transduction histidine kinase/ActR/RegA family two-component response regulator